VKKTYTTPELSELGSINEAVHADRVSLTPDGTIITGDMVLVLLTKSVS
jgi:hypothetical protein